MRIAVFATCLADAMFPKAAQATVVLLERLGHEVVFPPAQTCCGQMHINSGYQREALPLVRHHVDVFEDALVRRASTRSSRRRVPVWDRYATSTPTSLASRATTGSLGEQRTLPAGRTSCPSCSSTSSASRTWVPAIRTGSPITRRATRSGSCASATNRCGCSGKSTGIDLVELPEADTCCGFGGTFALKNADTSIAMMADKLRHVAETEAEVLTAGDSSCLMHLGGGLSRLRVGTRTVHLAEILAGEGWEAAL